MKCSDSLRLCWLLCLSAMLCAGVAGAQDLQPVPALSGRVMDLTATLAREQRDALERQLAALEADKGSQVVVLIVPTTQPEDIAAYANRVGNTWKIGRRGVGDGLLLVVAKNDRSVRIEVAKALEGAVPDLAARMIIDEVIVPAFRRGDFAAGLNGAVAQLGARIKGEALPPTLAAQEGFDAAVSATLLGLFVLLICPIVYIVVKNAANDHVAQAVTTGSSMWAAWALTSEPLWVVAAAVSAYGLMALFGAVLKRLNTMPPSAFLTASSDRASDGSSYEGSSSSDSVSSGGGGDFGGGGATGKW